MIAGLTILLTFSACSPSGSLTSRAWQEYVYGPDYVDEFVALVDDPLGAGVGTYYTLQDANYNLMATLRASGADGGPGGGTLTASNVVLRQYQWSPYGAPVVAETLTDNLPSAVTEAQAAAAGRIGHQGLFFERYDAGPGEPGIAANAAGIYYNRARFYTPYLGRFLQKDMNAAGLPVIAALAFNAAALDAFLDAFDAQSHYGDGMSLYAYAGSNPVNASDPLGLDWWDDDIDDAIDDITGHRLYVLGELNEKARWASIGLELSLTIASSLLGLDIFESVTILANGQGGFWEAMDVVTAAIPGGGPLRAIGKAAKYRKAARGAVACVGQWHHAISKRVHRALERHDKLKDKYKYRDDRFKTQAIDDAAHKGYQTWHRQLDDDIAKKIGSPEAKGWSEADFEAYLRSVYERSALLERFPNGL